MNIHEIMFVTRFSVQYPPSKDSEIRNSWSFERMDGRRVGPIKRVKYEGEEILPKTAGNILQDTLKQITERSPLCKPCVYYGTK